MKKTFKIFILALFLLNQTGITVFAEESEHNEEYEQKEESKLIKEKEETPSNEHANLKSENSDKSKDEEEEDASAQENQSEDDEENLDENKEEQNDSDDKKEKHGQVDEDEESFENSDSTNNLNEKEEEETLDDEAENNDLNEEHNENDDENDNQSDTENEQNDEATDEANNEQASDVETIDVYVLTSDATLYKDEVSFSKCSSFDGQVEDYYAYCALKQIDPNSLWTFYESFGNSAFLDQIFDIHSPEDWSAFWAYFKNREEGVLALNKDVFISGDELLVTLGAMPISIATTTDSITNATTTFQVKYFGYDKNFAPGYFDLADADVYFDGEYVGTTTPSGTFDYVVTLAGSHLFEAKKSGFADSKELEVLFTEQSNEEEIGGDNSGGGSGETDNSKKTLDVEALLSFLDSKQKSDGSFGSDLYTDWVAIAYGSQSGHSVAKEKLKSFLISDTLQGNSISDYERRAMALMALGINPYEGSKQNYIQEIFDSFDGTQFGDSDYVNDDIFAVIVLRNAGFTESDSEIQKAIEYIISKQSASGSIDSPDLTSAAIQALKLGSNNTSTSNSISKASNYLKSLQKNDGGFDNSYATSWIIMGLVSNNESPDSLINNSNSPFDYLANLQQKDGGLEDITLDSDSRVWTSSYAVPAGLQKTWDQVLENFGKEITENTKIENVENNSLNSSTDNSTTTEEVISDIPLVPTVLGASVSNEENFESSPSNNENLKTETEVEEIIPEEQTIQTATEDDSTSDTNNKNTYTFILIFVGLTLIILIIKVKKI